MRHYSCWQCFHSWAEEETEEERELRGIGNGQLEKKLCDFCTKNSPMSSLQLLHRQIDILETATIRDFPAFIKNLVKHVNLHHRD